MCHILKDASCLTGIVQRLHGRQVYDPAEPFPFRTGKATSLQSDAAASESGCIHKDITGDALTANHHALIMCPHRFQT